MGATHSRERAGFTRHGSEWQQRERALGEDKGGGMGSRASKHAFDLETGDDASGRDDHLVASDAPPGGAATPPVVVETKNKMFAAFRGKASSTLRQEISAVFLPLEPVIFTRAARRAAEARGDNIDKVHTGGRLVPIGLPTSPDEMLCITIGCVRIYADGCGELVLDTTGVAGYVTREHVQQEPDGACSLDADATQSALAVENGSLRNDTGCGEHEMVETGQLAVPCSQQSHDARVAATMVKTVVHAPPPPPPPPAALAPPALIDVSSQQG